MITIIYIYNLMDTSFINDELNNVFNGIINIIDIELIRNYWFIYIDYFNLNFIMSIITPTIILFILILIIMISIIKTFYLCFQILQFLYWM